MNGKDENDQTWPAMVGLDGYFGSSSGDYQSGAGTLTRSSGQGYAYIYAHEASSVDITSQDITGSLSGVVIPAGSYYRCGRATQVDVNSGTVTCYYA